mgnify:CR=1 FL=1
MSKNYKLVRIGVFVVFYCFFSGGRDSAVSCFISKRVADVKRVPFYLVHIDTTINIDDTERYVREYADWLGAELIVLRPEETFEEYAKKYPYWPSLYPPSKRWCYYELKLKPLVKFLRQNYRFGDVVVLGVRGSESLFRLGFYEKVFDTRCYHSAIGDICVKAWYPVLRLGDEMIEKLIGKFKIPRNPVWRIGSSGECLCLAGTSYKKLVRIAVNYPDVIERLVKIDDIIQSNRTRSDEPSYPKPLEKEKFTLRQWWEQFKKQQQITDYLSGTEYESCNACIW